jgi:hypothetical protein
MGAVLQTEQNLNFVLVHCIILHQYFQVKTSIFSHALLAAPAAGRGWRRGIQVLHGEKLAGGAV